MKVSCRSTFRFLVVAAGLIAALPAHAQLRGHGGPVRALAVSPDGATALSGSFDSSAIRWSLATDAAEQVLRFHDDAVNAVALLRDGRAVTAGADGRIAVWTKRSLQPDTVLQGHTAPIVGLSASPDGATLASASWDHTVRLWPLAGGPPRVLEGHSQNVNAVAFTPDGKSVVSAAYDLTLRIWPLDGTTPTVVTLPAPLSAVAVASDGEIVAAGANGMVYFLDASGAVKAELQATPTPVISLAISGDGLRVAVVGIRGSVTVIDRKASKIAHTLTGPGLPVWSVVFLPDNRTMLTGGGDRLVRRWDAITGEHIGAMGRGVEDPLAAYAGDLGAEVYRACVACHTLTPDEGNRAGPSLAGLFGRRIASLPGYNFSDALKKLDIVWTPETVAKLFEVGPAEYTPGTKMPEQRIGSPEDRKALTDFLAKATKPR